MQASAARHETSASDDAAGRRAVMGVLARCEHEELARAMAALGPAPAFTEIRPPEIGAVMLRGRIGGDGAPFNMGEATVTRCAVRLSTGETGSSYMLGRHPDKARIAAVIDALWQLPEMRPLIEDRVLEPIRHRIEQAASRRAEETAATRVEFFTVVRGED